MLEPFYKLKGEYTDFRQVYAPLHAFPQHLPVRCSYSLELSLLPLAPSFKARGINTPEESAIVRSGKLQGCKL